MTTPSSPAAETVRPALTRERILRAAIALADREGVDALSMRRLGAELGVEAMSLYNHFPNKAAMLDGMVETIVGDIELPEQIDDWKACIREMAHSYRGIALDHPKMVQLVAVRPFNTISTLRPMEVALEIFKVAGFDPETALHAIRTLAGFVTGYTLAETGSFFGEAGARDRLTIDDVPAEEFPRLVEAAPHLAAIDRDAEFEFALDVLLTGLEDKLQS